MSTADCVKLSCSSRGGLRSLRQRALSQHLCLLCSAHPWPENDLDISTTCYFQTTHIHCRSWLWKHPGKTQFIWFKRRWVEVKWNDLVLLLIQLVSSGPYNICENKCFEMRFESIHSHVYIYPTRPQWSLHVATSNWNWTVWMRINSPRQGKLCYTPHETQSSKTKWRVQKFPALLRILQQLIQPLDSFLLWYSALLAKWISDEGLEEVSFHLFFFFPHETF